MAQRLTKAMPRCLGPKGQNRIFFFFFEQGLIMCTSPVNLEITMYRAGFKFTEICLTPSCHQEMGLRVYHNTQC